MTSRRRRGTPRELIPKQTDNEKAEAARLEAEEDAQISPYTPDESNDASLANSQGSIAIPTHSSRIINQLLEQPSTPHQLVIDLQHHNAMNQQFLSQQFMSRQSSGQQSFSHESSGQQTAGHESTGWESDLPQSPGGTAIDADNSAWGNFGNANQMLPNSFMQTQAQNGGQGSSMGNQQILNAYERQQLRSQFYQPDWALQYGMAGQGQNGMEHSMLLQSDRPTIEEVHRRNQTFPINTAHDANLGNFRYADQNNALQHHPSVTGFGQPGQAHSVSVDHAAHNSASPPEGKVAITPMSQQQPLPTQPASIKPSGPMGPLSRDVVVPARPKPGRKPLPQEDAQDRRRVQNRMAQRNFRDKRALKVSELTADNERIRRESEDAYKKLANQLQDHKERNANLIKENERLRNELDAAVRRAEDADRKLHSIDVTQRFKEAGFPNAGLHRVGTGTALPPMTTSWEGPVGAYTATAGATATSDNLTSDEEYPETDMSAFWASTNRGSSNTTSNRNANNSHNHNRNHSHNNLQDNGTQWLGSGMDVDRPEDACGFCTDGNNCACEQARQAEVAQTTALAPGGCDACIRDPARAAACKALAAQTELSQRPSTLPTPVPGIEQRNDSMAQPGGMMSCSKFVDSLGSRVPSIHELFPGTFHSYPSQAGRGYDVNEQEAAQVLQSMSRRNTLAGPPASGGS